MDEMKEIQSMGSGSACVEQQRLTVQDLMVLLHDLVYILAAVALTFMFFFRLVTVDGDSMYPTLCNQDQVVMLCGIWCGTLEQGDIVVARAPDFSAEPLVKRIVALEGDTVDIDFEAGCVCVNGQVLYEAYVPEPTYLEFQGSGVTFPLQVEEGCVFLLGDNRNVSYDSRYSLIGQVDERNILGKVVFLAFPGRDHSSGQRNFQRIGMIEQEAQS